MHRPEDIVDFTPDPHLFPFESHWFDSSVGPVHYVDEGDGRPLLLLHGNPDWSFLYRKIIAALSDRFRCIAPDYPGFGLSIHPAGYGYTAEEHADTIRELVTGLDLDDMIVMGQDWGGPIGMDLASRQPERIHGLVMGNTWFWPADQRSLKIFSRLMGSKAVQYLITERNFFVRRVMRWSLEADLTDREFEHYEAVVPTPHDRWGIAEFPRQIVDAGPWLAEIAERVPRTLADKPVLLIFGRKDRALASDAIIARWQRTFPSATYVALAEANHYIQEDAPQEIADAIRAAFG